MSSSEEIESVAQSLLNVASECYGHCKETANLELIKGRLMACHVCPGRYVSRIIMYRKELDPKQLRDFVQEAAPGMESVEDSDVRVASRYAWDLGLDRKNNDLILREAYWTQSYRRTESDDSHRLALFLCSNKDSFFVQPLNSKERFCRNCRRRDEV